MNQIATVAASAPFLHELDVLTDLIDASSHEIESARRLPETLVATLVERNFFRLLLPRDLNGAGLDMISFLEVIEAIAARDASTAWCVCQTAGCSLISGYLSQQGAQDIFVDDPRGVLAWGPGPGARAVAVPGGYRVTAEASFVSGGHHASWIGCVCPVVDAEGKPHRDASGAPITRHMLFPATAGTFTDLWHVMGLKGTGSDSVRVENIFVPAHHSAARDDQTQRRTPDLIYSFPVVSLYAMGFPTIALGIARSMLTRLIALARRKTPRGMPQPMAASPVMQSKIAQCEARLASARHYLFATVTEACASAKPDGLIDLDRRVAIRLAGSHAMAQATHVVDQVYHAAGATAVFTANGFERKFRDMHAITQQVQGREAHFETVGCYLLGGEIDTAFL